MESPAAKSRVGADLGGTMVLIAVFVGVIMLTLVAAVGCLLVIAGRLRAQVSLLERALTPVRTASERARERWGA